jgi:hypothetical protein
MSIFVQCRRKHNDTTCRKASKHLSWVGNRKTEDAPVQSHPISDHKLHFHNQLRIPMGGLRGGYRGGYHDGTESRVPWPHTRGDEARVEPLGNTKPWNVVLQSRGHSLVLEVCADNCIRSNPAIMASLLQLIVNPLSALQRNLHIHGIFERLGHRSQRN